jgi:RNA-directed DNA polymerase
MRPTNANRTEGLIDWNAIDWKTANRRVRNLRQRIFRATQEGDWDKVQSLQRLMLRSIANAAVSVRRVTQVNHGKDTPGIDKLTVKTPEERSRLLKDIITLTPWRAKPTKRVYIPKANGKRRPLGIPVIRDRALQAMVKNALEPSWEARFEVSSYGFRPGRSAQDAIYRIWTVARRKTKVWIVDADIQGCFDNIKHDHLLETIGPFPAKALIHQWLKAGYVEMGQLHKTTTGTPQGGVISPLLANISLHGMEIALNATRPGHRAKRAVIRYADDFVIMCQTQIDAEQAQETIASWLAERGLQLSLDKTRIVQLKDGFDFLGFNVRIYPSNKHGKNGWITLIRPSKQSELKIRKRLRDEMRHLNGHNVSAVVQYLNPIIRGWANYFRTQVASHTFHKLDHIMFIRECQFVKRLHPNKPRYWHQAKYFGKRNPYRMDYHVFGDKETPHIYLYKFGWTKIIRHVLVKATNSPDDPQLTEYWQNRNLMKIHDLPPKPRELARRQKGVCPLCGASLFNDEHAEAHHIVRRNEGGPDTLENLVLLHLFCHQQVTATQRQQPTLRRHEIPNSV